MTQIRLKECADRRPIDRHPGVVEDTSLVVEAGGAPQGALKPFVSFVRKLETNWPVSLALMLLGLIALAALRSE